ncbi:stromelysin-1-like [Armigeres subalbatus]|uniref:stromelysin-1-like n=1 Tax=Armigeres subalbatus TaxID=124917 RepID=UPI002ED1B55A
MIINQFKMRINEINISYLLLIASISNALSASLARREATIIFPDDWESIKSGSDVAIQESSSRLANLGDLKVAPVVPVDEPEMTENDAMEFLEELGFNSTVDNSNGIGLRFSDVPSSGILRYQQQFGLNETGELDRETKISLKSPKCGVSNVAAHGEDFKWGSPSLTYYVKNTPSGIATATVKEMLRNAFNQWSKVTTLDFVESNDPEADIEIVFGVRTHDSRSKKCRNVLGDTTLAHSFYPETGAIHFNTKFFPGSMNKDEFFTTAMHEIGHAIGLEHSVSKASLMYPIPVARFSEIPEPDVEKIQLKYGKRLQKEPIQTPTFCDLTQYDAVMYGSRGKLHIFAGKYCYTKFNSNDEPLLLREMWPGAPDMLDAAVTIGAQTFIFKGDQVWAFKNGKLQIGYPRRIRDTFPGLPRNLDAVAFDQKKYVYAFKNDHYWRYNTREKTVDLSDEVEDFGISSRIDAALFSNGKLFLFKDQMRHVYSFDTRKTERYDSPLFDCKIK